MIWAGMRADGRVIWRFFDEYYASGHTTATAEGYCNLLRNVLPEIYEPGQGFLQDNARIHTAKLSQQLFQEYGVWVVEHPPYSPDLNAIEHLWIFLKEMTYKLHPELKYMQGGNIRKKQALKNAIKHAISVIESKELWDIPARLIASIPDRIQAVLAVNGYQTKY